jgi:hypothetical protein
LLAVSILAIAELICSQTGNLEVSVSQTGQFAGNCEPAGNVTESAFLLQYLESSGYLLDMFPT